MAIPKLTKQEITKRKRLIVSFVKKNPNCSKDLLFRKKVLPKSKTNEKLFDELVQESKLGITHTKQGRAKYYIPDSKDSPQKRDDYIIIHCKEIIHLLSQIKDDTVSDVISLAKKLVKLRMQIFQFEINRKIQPKTFLLDKDIAVVKSFLQKQGINTSLPFWDKNFTVSIFGLNPTRQDTLLYLDTNIKYADIFKTHHFDTYLKLDGQYKKKKKLRSIQDKIRMKNSDDNIAWELSRRDFLEIQQSITREVGTADYQKIIDYHNAENQSSLYNNDEWKIYGHMKKMIENDSRLLSKMARNFSLPKHEVDDPENMPSHDYEKDIANLSKWWNLATMIALIRMENRLSGNKNTQVKVESSDGILDYEFVDNRVTMDDDEKRKKEFLMDLALLPESSD